jgi:tryptophanyl-tRNA synthetase
MSKQELVLSGVQPSGSMIHLGNYLGAMKRFVELQEVYPTIFCIVDLHALTTFRSAKELTENTLSLAAAYLAIGIDPAKSILFRQSDIPEVTELTWYLSCHFPLGLLERAHSIKDARARGEAPNSGKLLYPILMAADILLPRATLVPVGADQKQHLEMTREIAEKFNHQFGEIFPVPQPLIAEESASVIGLDGRKMSKSYDNYIGLFEPTKQLRKKIMTIVTDSKTVEEAKDPKQCNIFNLYQLIASPEESADLSERYRAGGLGYGHAKEALFQATERLVAPLRERYEGYLAKPDFLRDVLRDGANRLRPRSLETLALVREAFGIGNMLK